MGDRRISVVVISRNEGAELRRTIENFEDTLPDGSEVIVVDDGSTDSSTAFLARTRRRSVRLVRVNGFGVARARNLGARLGRHDRIVYADAHIRLESHWSRPLLELLDNPKVGGAAPAVTDLRRTRMFGCGLTFKNKELEVKWGRDRSGPHAMPIIPGCCFATRRDVVEHTGGWDESQLQRGNVDNEGCVRFWLMGYDLMVTPETLVKHKFRKRSPYHVGWPEYLFNRLRLAFVHLKPERLGKVVAALRNYPGYGQALALLAESDIAERRREIHRKRVRDDDWLFERFGLKW